MNNQREIKFRAWNTGLKEMVISQAYVDDTGSFCLPKGMTVSNGGSLIWMQFTGRVDKKGNPIFEGDILRWTNNDYEPLEEDYQVVFEDSAWRIICIRMPDSHKDILKESDLVAMEIIGNIYENPELLNKEEK